MYREDELGCCRGILNAFLIELAVAGVIWLVVQIVRGVW